MPGRQLRAYAGGLRSKATPVQGQRFAFPRYNGKELTAGIAPVVPLNKWLKGPVGLDHTIHELRHPMADRLRNVQCPADIRLAIGEWMAKGVGEGYGDGYELRIKAEWLAKAMHE